MHVIVKRLFINIGTKKRREERKEEGARRGEQAEAASYLAMAEHFWVFPLKLLSETPLCFFIEVITARVYFVCAVVILSVSPLKDKHHKLGDWAF